MAQPAKNYREVRDCLGKIRRRPVARRPDLLGILLFDDRQSHRIVQDFARDEFAWLDGLARVARMVLFLFLPRRPAIPQEADGGRPAQVLVAEGGSNDQNPSLELAARFGLTAKDLPGIVFFTELNLDRPGPHSGVFCPLSN